MSLPHPAGWFLLSQLGWFSCILGAAHGHLWLGPAVVGCVSALFVCGEPHRVRAFLRLCAVALVGLLTDSCLIAGGVLGFSDAVQLLPLLPGPPLWMVALWVGFGTTLGGLLRGLRRRPLAAAAVGAVFGALGYRAGVALGAASLGTSAGVSLAAISLAWALVLPLLLRIDALLDGTPDPFAPS